HARYWGIGSLDAGRLYDWPDIGKHPGHEASDGLAAPDHPERGVGVVIPIELAARALLAQKPREAELAQLSPNLLGRCPQSDDAKLRLGRRRLSRRDLRGVATALRSP